uniref:Uncharacterized protein n=1 Tax=Cacopsylla melanoneura TaxID=428564 RepID=A0A8D9DQ14_9HEMI
MLRKKHFFEHGPKSIILYVFLTLALHGKASDASSHTEFGCEFADDQYKMILSDKKQPVWVPNTNIESVQLFRGHGNDKDRIFTEITFNLFSEYNIMNELSLFTRFVNDHKKSFQTVESFFNNYTVPFQPKTYYNTKTNTSIRRTTDPASYLIQELHALQESLKTENKSVSPYLVSAYVDPIEFPIEFNLNFSNPSIYDNVDKLLHKPVQDHVAAVIKTYHGTRNGYILIDPGYANGEKLINPFFVFVMEDGKYPHGEFMDGFRHNEKIEFTKRKENPFILANYKNSKSVTNVLYYVGKPYCSFMENTIKASLLRLNHGIIARVPHSQRQGYLTFNISPENKNETQDHNNWLIIREIGNTTSGEMKEEKLSFMNFSNPMLVNETIDTALGISITKSKVTMITAQLQYIQTELFGNSKLMSKFIELNNKHGLDKEGQKSKKISGKRKRLGCF